MNIIWNPNPLATVVELNDTDREMLVRYIQNERYSDILCDIEMGIADGKITSLDEAHLQAKKWEEICELNIDCDMVKTFEEELKQGHMGDCTCVPCSCLKCHAEYALGICTIAGLGNHEASAVQSAFGDSNEKTIEQAIEFLQKEIRYEDRHPSWEKYSREDYEKHIPVWEPQRRNALEWLIKYKLEHGF